MFGAPDLSLGDQYAGHLYRNPVDRGVFCLLQGWEKREKKKKKLSSRTFWIPVSQHKEEESREGPDQSVVREERNKSWRGVD